jgi:hypothetical protein
MKMRKRRKENKEGRKVNHIVPTLDLSQSVRARERGREMDGKEQKMTTDK